MNVSSSNREVFPELPSPISVEISELESGERFTTLRFPDPFVSPVRKSVDQIFSDGRDAPVLLIDPLVWHIIRPWLNNSDEEIAKFWAKFDTPEAAANRYRAAFGVKYSNWTEERTLIHLVRTVRRLQSGTSDQESSSMELSLILRLGEWVMRAVETDHEAPRRLHKLLKDPGASDDRTNRDLTPRNLLDAFARIVCEDEQLPTKKMVRERACLGNSDNAKSIASRKMRDLGLSGLPEG